MALSRKRGHWYGTDDSDVQTELVRYSKANGYETSRFWQAACLCGGSTFELETDEDVGVARRVCAACGSAKLMGDSAEYAAEAHLENHICACDHPLFAITSGVALYPDSNDIRWYYIGCRCRSCNLVGVFADWKSESGDADAFLVET